MVSNIGFMSLDIGETGGWRREASEEERREVWARVCVSAQVWDSGTWYCCNSCHMISLFYFYLIPNQTGAAILWGASAANLMYLLGSSLWPKQKVNESALHCNQPSRGLSPHNPFSGLSSGVITANPGMQDPHFFIVIPHTCNSWPRWDLCQHIRYYYKHTTINISKSMGCGWGGGLVAGVGMMLGDWDWPPLSWSFNTLAGGVPMLAGSGWYAGMEGWEKRLVWPWRVLEIDDYIVSTFWAPG